jgi:cysteine-rich repeat protein
VPSIRSATLALLLLAVAPAAVRASCGDGVLDPGGGCDTAIDYGGGADCDPNCTFEGCGNGYQRPWEECDDGNLVPGDGCGHCRLEVCGNGVLDPGEECDDGNLADGDACDAGCRAEARGYLACYRARRAPGTPPRADRLRPVAVCWGDGVLNPTLQLVCYRTPARGRVTHRRSTVRDYLGEATLAVSRPSMTCLPSTGARVFTLVRAFRGTGLDTTYEDFGSGLAGTEDSVYIGGPTEPGSAILGVVRRYDRATGALVATLVPPTVTYRNGTTDLATGVGRLIVSSGDRLLAGFAFHRIYSSPDYVQPTAAAIYDVASGALIGTRTTLSPFDVAGMALLGPTLLVANPAAYTTTFPSYKGALHAFRDGVVDPDLVRDPLGPGTGPEPRHFADGVVALGGDAYVAGYVVRVSPTHYPSNGFVERLEGGTWQLRRVYESPAPQQYQRFGSGLAVLGDRLVVAAGSGNVLGAVYVIDPDSGAVTATLAEPPPGSGWLGSSLATRGTEVLAGAQYTSALGVRAGAAHLYDGQTGERRATFLNPEPRSTTLFGARVARAGDDVLVATHGEGQSLGVVYQYAPRRPPALRCSLARATEGSQPARALFVGDRVDAGKTAAGDPDALCAPADEPGPSLACRRVRDGVAVGGEVAVENALGVQRLLVGRRQRVCLPAEVGP